MKIRDEGNSQRTGHKILSADEIDDSLHLSVLSGALKKGSSRYKYIMHKEHGVMALHIASVQFLNGRSKARRCSFRY